jgi:D-alanine transaminase
MMSSPLVTPSQEAVDRGVYAITATDFRWLNCDVKSTSLLGNCLLRQEAADAGAIEAILFRDGYLTEASSSNVFVVSGGKVLAPPKNHLVLPGITYDVVLELVAANGVPYEVREIGEREVRTAEEVWLTSSTKEVLAVTRLDDKPVGGGKPGAVFRRVHALYQEFKRSVMRQAA